MTQYGLEGMTAEDYREMEEEFAEERRLYREALERHRDRFLPKSKRAIYAQMGLNFGCGYEEAFRSGWFAAIGIRQCVAQLVRAQKKNSEPEAPDEAKVGPLQKRIEQLEADNDLLAQRVTDLMRQQTEREVAVHRREGQADYIMELAIDKLKEAGAKDGEIQRLQKQIRDLEGKLAQAKQQDPWRPIAEDAYVMANGVHVTVKGDDLFVQDMSGHDTIVVLGKKVRLCCREETP